MRTHRAASRATGATILVADLEEISVRIVQQDDNGRRRHTQVSGKHFLSRMLVLEAATAVAKRATRRMEKRIFKRKSSGWVKELKSSKSGGGPRMLGLLYNSWKALSCDCVAAV